jgi:hypothetical protein
MIVTTVGALKSESERARVMREFNERTINFSRGDAFLHVSGYGYINARSMVDVTSTFEHALAITR